MALSGKEIVLYDRPVKVQVGKQEVERQDRHAVQPSQFDAAWEAQAPEHGVCLRANHSHPSRGGVFFYPEPLASLLREALGTQIQAAEPKGA